MHSMWQALVLFFNIAIFKNRPQDLPATNEVFYLGVGLAILLSLLRYVAVPTDSYSILHVVLEVIVPAGLLYLLLTFFKHKGRFAQTFAAICGSGAIIYALALPVLPAFYEAASSRSADLSIYLIILFDIWSVAVMAFILKNALEVGTATSISLSIALGLTAYLIVSSIAPVSQAKQSEELSSLQSVPAWVAASNAKTVTAITSPTWKVSL